LATYRQHRLQITSTNGRWLLETDVSIIDSTPQAAVGELPDAEIADELLKHLWRDASAQDYRLAA
jgi:hypothetical protein